MTNVEDPLFSLFLGITLPDLWGTMQHAFSHEFSEMALQLGCSESVEHFALASS